jgi:antitoxin (DNA-binding transcriptional repressor) of toxin-antitoxin stability system
MQRAAAGEEFQVERRGRPYVRLTGPADSRPKRRGVFAARYAA